MPHRHFYLISVFTAALLMAGCSVDLTGLEIGSGLGGGCCEWYPPPCTTSCAAMDPGSDQRILVGDTIDIFFNGSGIAATWKYDSASFASTQPADVVTHRGSSVSHIALRALGAGISSITASTGVSTGTVRVEMILPSEVRGLGVKTLPCPHMSVTDPACGTTSYPWDTASFKSGDVMRVVSSTWTQDGALVASSAQWSSSNPNVVEVGRVFSEYFTTWLPVVIARSAGVATISATAAGYSGSIDVTVVR